MKRCIKGYWNRDDDLKNCTRIIIYRTDWLDSWRNKTREEIKKAFDELIQTPNRNIVANLKNQSFKHRSLLCAVTPNS
jgi:hypothetical protein